MNQWLKILALWLLAPLLPGCSPPAPADPAGASARTSQTEEATNRKAAIRAADLFFAHVDNKTLRKR